MIVSVIPRHPFLEHSQRLISYLVSRKPVSGHSVLEIGCGANSPLVPMLYPILPDLDLHQIDARADVIPKAKAYCPISKVEHMYASAMETIADSSKHMVVAMSVFDQVHERDLERIAQEVHRVLARDGIVVYVHNEELNAPALAASLLYASMNPLRLNPSPEFLMPNDRWHPTNTFEYCTGSKSDVEHGLNMLGSQADKLRDFIVRMHPEVATVHQAQAGSGKVDAVFIDEWTPEYLTAVRQQVAMLRRVEGVHIRDRSTVDMLASKIERRMFSSGNGFEVVCGGMFEIRTCLPWGNYFKQPPAQRCFVRGVAKFGYAADQSPSPTQIFRQELNHIPVRENGEVEFVAYQYGMIARRI